MSLVTDANDTIRRLEAELAEAESKYRRDALWMMADLLGLGLGDYEMPPERMSDLIFKHCAWLVKRSADNAARNERLRWAKRADALAAWNSEHPGYTAEHALEALATELRAGGGGA